MVSGVRHFLIANSFAAEGHPAGPIPWLKLGPVGLMCFVGGVTFSFLLAEQLRLCFLRQLA
jgi:hypothetical protein